MKKVFLFTAMLTTAGSAALAQESNTTVETNKEITPKNAWLKVGLTAAMPIGDASKISTFSAGVDLRGQFMSTRHFGLGLASGYNHYFGKNGAKDFGAIPLELMLRYYPKSEGLFVGADLGYSFLTNTPGLTGGITVKPEIGYHNYNWNFFAFYNHIITKSSAIDIQSVGVTALYNIRFHK